MENGIIYLLLFASVIGLTIIVERALALRSRRILPPEVEGALASCRTAEDLPMLLGICAQHPSPLSRLILQAAERRHWSKAENSGALETTARHEVVIMERRLVILEIVVGVSPLLGLVGTIYGMIQLFGGLAETGMGDNSVLSRGIALALNSTLLGLLAAIPSLIAWSYFNRKVESYAVEMAALCDGFLIRQYQMDGAGALEGETAPRGQ
jgi:biopolymer transport protein ExbB